MSEKSKSEKRTDFLKNLLLVVLVPFVVSSFTFASKYGSDREIMNQLVQNQTKILTELDEYKKTQIVETTRREADSRLVQDMNIKLNGVDTKVSELGIKVAGVESGVQGLKAATNSTKEDTNRRLSRLEDILMNSSSNR